MESWLWNPGCGSSLGTLWGLSGGWGGPGVAMGRSGLGRFILLQIHCKTQQKIKKGTVLRETGEHRCANSLFFTANSRGRRAWCSCGSVHSYLTKPPEPLQSKSVCGTNSNSGRAQSTACSGPPNNVPGGGESNSNSNTNTHTRY